MHRGHNFHRGWIPLGDLKNVEKLQKGQNERRHETWTTQTSKQNFFEVFFVVKLPGLRIVLAALHEMMVTKKSANLN